MYAICGFFQSILFFLVSCWYCSTVYNMDRERDAEIASPWGRRCLFIVTCRCVCKGAFWQPARTVLWQTVGRDAPSAPSFPTLFNLMSPFSSPFLSEATCSPYSPTPQFFLACRSHYTRIHWKLACTWPVLSIDIGWAQPDVPLERRGPAIGDFVWPGLTLNILIWGMIEDF